ncbi:MAG: MmgE/PrpD family protein, partial [Acetobacterales bacterium]
MDSSDTPGLTRHVAEFVVATRAGDLPTEVVELGKTHILDALGLSLSGMATAAGEILSRYVADQGCTGGGASVLGTGLKTIPRFAAFANGTCMHMDDFDDTNPPAVAGRNGGVHATVSALAGALAIAERDGRSGQDLLTAVMVGTEVTAKLNHASSPRHYESGFHATGTLNGFGTAAAVARLLGADAAAVQRSIGLAASQSSGLRENFGTMTKPFHAGHAAECGLVAADLVTRGFTAAENVLEAPRGFFSATGGAWDPAPIIGRMGNPWAIADPGTWLKPYPSGALNHPAMTLLSDLIAEHDIEPAQVKKVTVTTNRRFLNVLLHGQPSDGLQAKFSLPFCLAILILRRRAGLAEYTDEVVALPEVKEMIGRIEHVAYDDAKPDYTSVTTFLDIELADGRRIGGRADFGRGNPKRRMTFNEVAEKARG